MAGISQARPLVLVTGLEPMVRVGIARALADGGADVLDHTRSSPDALVRAAAESGPDAIVLGDRAWSDHDLGARLRAAAPGATFVSWHAGADAVAVLAPGTELPRVMPAPTAAELSDELLGRAGKGESCPST